MIAGVACRALAVSAARSGYRVTAVDPFGDVDLRAACDVVAVSRDSGGFTPTRAAAAARAIRAGMAAYTSNFENYPEAVAELASGRRLLGNPPDVLRAVRDPLSLMRALRSRGIPTPAARSTAPRSPGRPASWLLKPRRSGGGHGTRLWRGEIVPRHAYLQERIRGVPGSVIFLADGERIWPLGITRQLVGERTFGATGFRYCGSLLGSPRVPLFEHERRLRAAALELAQAVAEHFGLVGLNGVDFVVRDGVPWPIEVNPRPCASMELVERAGARPLFELHRRACLGRLPSTSSSAEPAGILGKAVVFARRDVTVAGSLATLEAAADLPHPGERIGRGHPICTVFGHGRNAADCLRALATRAHAVYAALERRLAA